MVGSFTDDLDTDGNGSVDAFNAGSAYVYTRSGTVWNEEAKLTATDAASDDEFGFSVSVFDDTVVATSRRDDVDDDGDGTVDVLDVGSAYVHQRIGGVWSEQERVSPDSTVSGPEAYAEFGYSVAVDGDTMVVGAYRADGGTVDEGAAFVYRRNDNGTALDETDDFWQQEARLEASDAASSDQFGFSVSISGNTIVVGSRLGDIDIDGDGSNDTFNTGSVYVFTRTGSTWIEETKLFASDAGGIDLFGWSVSISGDTVVVGSRGDDLDTDGNGSLDAGDAGSAYVFTRSGLSWNEEAKLTASDAASFDQFGFSVSISGDTVAVGSRLDEVDIDGNGSNDASNAGSVYVFTRSGTVWSEETKLTASDAASHDQFGYSRVDLWRHGRRGKPTGRPGHGRQRLDRRVEWRFGVCLHAQREQLGRGSETHRIRRHVV